MANGISITQFIKSIAVCIPWVDNTGGKSNASFGKSFDNLFVFKSLAKNEFKMFGLFARDYFEYMEETISKENPCVLAKMYGMFEIHLNKEKYYYIVMENLLFESSNNKSLEIYDLKGSESNRFISKKVKETQVLLDTNFKIEHNGEPLPIRFSDKKYLNTAIDLDTNFLCSQNLIDYSLLVIIDKTNFTVTLGIIDYLRLYTWDKHLESVGKTVINAGTLPTIVNAEEYRRRFINAINQYFAEID